jgi:4-amino-4-deoxychorismate lyase
MSKASLIAIDEWAYLNGQRVSLDEARVPISDGGWIYGMGFFETFRTNGGRPHLWRLHRERLTRSCARAGITIPMTFLVSDENALRQAISDALRETGRSDAVFRYTITAGNAEGPTELMTMRPLPDVTNESKVNLHVLKVRRDCGEWIPRPKSVNYLNAMLGLNELKSRHAAPADEGLFLSRDGGVVVETPRQNLAWMKEGRIWIVDDSAGAVAGTCQTWVQSLGFPVVAVRAKLDEFLRAEAIVCLNSVRGFTAVADVWDDNDAHCLARMDSASHPTVRQLQQAWQDALALTARS